MKKRSTKSLFLNKKAISNLHEVKAGAKPSSDNSIDVSCFMSCVNYSKYETCPDG